MRVLSSLLSAPNYPPTRSDTTTFVYHGTPVSDPYHWLEDINAPTTQTWIDSQNQLTRNTLETLPRHASLKARLREIWNYPRRSLPHSANQRRFFLHNTGLQNQPVLYMQSTPEAEVAPVLDPNTLSADGTVALTDWAPSSDGCRLVYAITRKGSDWQELRIRNTDTGEDYPEVLYGCKSEDEVHFSKFTWRPDRTSLYYYRYPLPDSVPPKDQYRHCQVYLHLLDTPQSADALIYERPDDKELAFVPIVTGDGRYLVLHMWRGLSRRNRIYWRPVESDQTFVPLLNDEDARYDFLGNSGDTFFFVTNLDAPQSRVIAVDLAQPDRRHWREVVPEQDEPLERAWVIGERLIVATLHNVQHRLRVYDLAGQALAEIPLPAWSAVVEITGDPDSDGLLVALESFLSPEAIWRYEFATGHMACEPVAPAHIDCTAYETRQVFYPAQDGTPIPMFLVQRQGLALSGDHPTLLYGYGGFNGNVLPTWLPPWLVWLEQGGILAVANLRGGSEYGEAWHQAGMRERKQTVFDDFIAAAEWLIAQGYTHPTRLVISGESNGGLLVTTCLIQRPDLFAAATCDIPVTDMLRYHKATIGADWIPEYGNAEADPLAFAYLSAYSPLHNVRPGVKYPPLLAATAEYDDRVVPSHAMKFIATLQSAGGPNAALLRVERAAGHGLGRPTTKLIEAATDVLTFLLSAVGQ